MQNSLVIIPTYNEVDNVDLMIESVFSISNEAHILIVDDSSPDGTSKKVEILQKKYIDKLFLIERHEKRGLGTAYITGFKWGLTKSYKYFFQMDCDFSHNPNDLIRMYIKYLSSKIYFKN